MISRACSLNSGVKSITSSTDKPKGSKGSGRVGIGWVAAVQLPGTSVCKTSISSIGHTGSPVSLLKVNTKPCLVVWMTAGTSSPSTSKSTISGTLGRS